MSTQGETYKPTEHGGLKEDGTIDKRVNTGKFAQGKVDPHEAGQKGGSSTGSSENNGAGSGGAKYKPTEHGGMKEDGTKDGRVGTGVFAHGKVDPHEAGHQGGSK